MVHPKKNQAARVLCDGEFPYGKNARNVSTNQSPSLPKPAYEMRSVKNPPEQSGKNAGARGYIKDANTRHPFNPVLTIVLCTSHTAAAFNYFFSWTTCTICIEFLPSKLKGIVWRFLIFLRKKFGGFY
jgi:hypothetical protein